MKLNLINDFERDLDAAEGEEMMSSRIEKNDD